MHAREHRRGRVEDRRRLAAARTADGRDVPWRRRWRMFRRRVGGALVRWFAPAVLRVLAGTWRIERRDDGGLSTLCGPGPWIAALWHGRMLVAIPISPHRRRGIGVLVSPSDDGSLVTKALANFGYAVIRGSAGNGGARAMRDLFGSLGAGCPVVVTPDGPRGPRHSVNPGAAWLARETQAPIVPVAFAVDRAWRLRSWDRFTIPKPFARIVVGYCGPLRIDADAEDLELERAADRLRTMLIAAERAGFARLGISSDLPE